MSRSTSSPYPRTFHPLRYWRWCLDDLAAMELELELDEQERIRAAENIADYKFMEHLALYNEALNRPRINLQQGWSLFTKPYLQARGSNGVRALLREFWRERV